MKKTYTFKVFFICSVHDSLKLTELYFSGTEAAEPKKSSQLPLNMDQFEKILYIQKIILIHSVTTSTYNITSSVCLLRISAALCLAWKQKKTTFDQIYKNLFVNSSKRQSQELDFRR